MRFCGLSRTISKPKWFLLFPADVRQFEFDFKQKSPFGDGLSTYTHPGHNFIHSAHISYFCISKSSCRILLLKSFDAKRRRTRFHKTSTEPQKNHEILYMIFATCAQTNEINHTSREVRLQIHCAHSCYAT